MCCLYLQRKYKIILELKILRVVQRIKQETNLKIKATFLGAHALPRQLKMEQYTKTTHT